MSQGFDSSVGGAGTRAKMDLGLGAGMGSWPEGVGRAGDSGGLVCEEESQLELKAIGL